MDLQPLLFQIFVVLGSSVLLVALFQRLGLGSILGYLAAGILIGPQITGVIKDGHSMESFAEFGVVFLLFVIGLELQPKKLWAMKKTLLGFGGLQILFCSLAFALLARLLGLEWITSGVVGFSLSLSSTAFALQSLTEKKVLNTEFGRASFAILLMQDVVAIPALAVIPTLGLVALSDAHPVNWGQAALIAVGLAVLSRFVMGPFLRQIAALRSRELFTGVTLMIVMGVAFLMHQSGLSMALGAFLAGVFLSESEYRHELQADLEPFRGLFMGLFFVSVGVTVNLSVIFENPAQILGLTLVYMVVKFLVIYGIGRSLRLNSRAAKSLAIYLVQGGEFAFVIFGLSQTTDVISADWSQRLTVMVTLSMLISPFIIAANDRYEEWCSTKGPEPEYDRIENAQAPVIIAGFGRFGQIFGRILRTQEIDFIAIDHDSEQIELLRRFGNKVFYGDASRKEILEAAGAANAKYFILAIDDVESATAIARTLREDYPHLKIFARARNRNHVFDLMEAGVPFIKREMLDSSLSLTKELLVELGYPRARAESMIERFRVHDEFMVKEQFKVRKDEKVFLDVARQGVQQLAQVLREDSEKTYIDTEKKDAAVPETDASPP
jgi:monovalent cation:proton antiporter-2 (CPA2) family protein